MSVHGLVLRELSAVLVQLGQQTLDAAQLLLLPDELVGQAVIHKQAKADHPPEQVGSGADDRRERGDQVAPEAAHRIDDLSSSRDDGPRDGGIESESDVDQGENQGDHSQDTLGDVKADRVHDAGELEEGADNSPNKVEKQHAEQTAEGPVRPFKVVEGESSEYNGETQDTV